jgi:hypothetical protein
MFFYQEFDYKNMQYKELYYLNFLFLFTPHYFYSGFLYFEKNYEMNPGLRKILNTEISNPPSKVILFRCNIPFQPVYKNLFFSFDSLF